MSSVIDDRIVQMSFDNRNFESNVQQSLKTIDKLNSSLKATESTTAFDTLDKSAKKLNFDGLVSSVESISNRFSTLGIIGMAVLENLANKAVDLGMKLASSLSVDQIMAGWNKYADKTSSVQTIMAATASTWEKEAETIGFAGSQMEYVEGILEKLNWFTDETSYNFTDMVSNIGKFTSNGVALNEAATAMQGIANWAAISGQNATKASQAMYNISQAMGVGSMKVIDWKSIENANMATREFKEAAIEAAVATGTLKKDLKATKKNGEETWVTQVKGAKKATVTMNSFRDSLQKGWFTSEVMMKVFKDYGGAADALYELSNAADYAFTTSEILNFVDAYQNGSKSIEQISKETGLDIELLQKNFDYLTSDIGKFGLKTFKAAQEAKTFAEAIDATKDAVSTGWMRIFQDIFGNYEEAKKIWTGLANYLYDVFAEPLNQAHEILQKWKAGGGWAALFDEETGAFWNLGEAISAIIQPAKDAWAAIFPNTVDPGWWVEKLTQLSKGFQSLVERMKPSEQTANRLQRIFQGLFAIVDLGRNFFNALGRVLKEYLYPVFSDLFDKAFDGAATLGDLVVKLRDYVNENDSFYTILKKIADVIKTGFEKAADIVGQLADKFEELTGIDLHVPTFEELANVWERLTKIGDILKGVLENIRIVWSNFVSGLKGEEQVAIFGEGTEKLEKFSNAFYKVGSALHWVAEKAKEFGGAFGDKVKEVFNGKGINVGNVLKIAASIVVFKKAFDFAKARFELKSIWKSIKNTFAGIPDVLDGVSSAFEAFAFNTNALALKNIAIAIGILTAALIALSLVDGEKLAQSLASISLVMTELVGAMAVMSAILGGPIGGLMKASALKSAGKALMEVGIAVALLAVSIKLISDLDAKELGIGLAGVAASLILLGSALVVLNKIGVSKISGIGISMMLVAAAMVVMAAAIKKMGSLSFEQIAKGFIGIASSLLLMSVALGVLTKLGANKMSGVGIAMLGIAAAMLVMATAIEKMAAIDLNTFISGLLRIAAVLGVLVIAFAAMPASGAVGSAAAILIVSAALLVLQVALVKIGEMDSEAIAKALIAIAASLIFICAALALCEGNLAGAAAILVVAASLAVLAPVIERLGSMNLETLAKGLISMAAALAIFIIAGEAGTGAALGLILLAAGILAMDLALAGLIPSFERLGAMSLEDIGKALLALAGALAELILAAAAAEALAIGFLVLTAAFIGLGAAATLVGLGMNLAVGAIQALCAITNMDKAAADLEQMALSFVQIGGAGVVVLAAIPGILSLAAALSVLSVGSAALAISLPTTIDSLLKFPDVRAAVKGSGEIASGLKEIGKAFKDFAKSEKDVTKAVNSITQISEKVKSLATSCATMGESMAQFTKAMEYMLSFGDSFNQALIKMGSGITTMSNSVAMLKSSGAVETLDKTASTLGRFASSAQSLADGIVSSINSMYTFIMLKGQIEEAAPGIKKVVSVFLNELLNILRSYLPQFKSTGASLINNLAQGMSGMKGTVTGAVRGVASAAEDEARSYRSDFYSAGAYLGEGFASGISSKKSAAEKAAGKVADAASKRMKKVLSEESPSKVTKQIGAYFTEGFAIGITSAGKEATDATEDMLSGVLATAEYLSDRIRKKLEEEGSPVITPVLDTSMIEAGASRLSSTVGGMSIPATLNRAGLASSSFTTSGIQNGSGEVVNSTNNYFTQNNYSPKSLSRVDIYRQTKNLFSAQKGAVRT